MKWRIFIKPEREALKRKQELHMKIMRVSSLDAITYFGSPLDHRIQFKNTFPSSFLDALAKLWKAATNFFLKCSIWGFFEIQSKKSTFDYSLTELMDTLHEDLSVHSW